MFLARDLHWIVSGEWRIPHVSGALLESIEQASLALLSPEISAEHSCGWGSNWEGNGLLSCLSLESTLSASIQRQIGSCIVHHVPLTWGIFCFMM